MSDIEPDLEEGTPVEPQPVILIDDETWQAIAPKLGARQVEYTPAPVFDDQDPPQPTGMWAMSHPDLNDQDSTLIAAWHAVQDKDDPNG